MNKTILLLEDVNCFSSILCKDLQNEGFKVICCHKGEEGINIFFNNKIDLILLDILLPDIDGLKVLDEIRNKSDVPVIMLTVVNYYTYQKKCLSLGVKDYVVKPCCSELLIQKINNILNESYEDDDIYDNFWSYGELEVNFLKKIVVIEGEEVYLGKKRFEILKFLVNNKGNVLSRDQIIDVVWGTSHVNDRTVDTHISKIRTSLNLDCIKSVSGYGYILDC